MTTRRRTRFVHGQVAWMLGTILVCTVLGIFSIDLFFICSMIGLLVLTAATAPVNVAPAWRRRLPWLAALGLVGVVVLVVRRIVPLLPPEVVPS